MTENKILEIKYVLIPFMILMFTLVIFWNYFLFLWVFVLFLVYYVYLALYYENVNFLSILFVVWSLTISSYVFFMYHTYDSFTWYRKVFVRKNFVVQEKMKFGKYLIQDDFNNYFVWIKIWTWYNVWDKIKVYGMLYPVKLPYKNFYEWEKKDFMSFDIKFSKIRNLFKFSYDKYLEMKGITWIIYSKKTIKKWKEKLSYPQKIRKWIIKRTNKLYKDYDDKYKALSLWLLIWDKTFLTKPLYDEFIKSGLVHIIVVSGWNIMFLIIFLSLVLFFIPFYIRLFVIWTIVIFYAMMVGGDSSVIRATIMWILSLLALFLWKIYDIKRILAIAFILMLLYNPYFIWYDLGFILSFLAILWIVYMNKFVFDIHHLFWFEKHITKLYNNYVLPTFWATVFTSIPILLFTKRVNLLAFFASVAVIPIVPLLMLLSFLAVVFNSDFIVWINVWLMKYIYFVSYVYSSEFTLFVRI